MKASFPFGSPGNDDWAYTYSLSVMAIWCRWFDKEVLSAWATILTILTAPGMSRAPSALQVSLARWLPPNILLHFCSLNSFHRSFSGNPRNLVKRLLWSKLYFFGDLEWMPKGSLLNSWPIWVWTPFLQGLVLSAVLMIRCAVAQMRKCWFYRKWL